MARVKAEDVATVAGLGIGGWVGAGIGIAGFFGAISGLVPVALIGGYAARKLAQSKFARELFGSPPPPQSYVAEDTELPRRRRRSPTTRTRDHDDAN